MLAAHVAVFGIDPKSWLNSLSPYGEMVLWLIIFAETGLLLGFFLPGDSLLFTAGLLAGRGTQRLARRHRLLRRRGTGTRSAT